MRIRIVRLDLQRSMQAPNGFVAASELCQGCPSDRLAIGESGSSATARGARRGLLGQSQVLQQCAEPQVAGHVTGWLEDALPCADSAG